MPPKVSPVFTWWTRGVGVGEGSGVGDTTGVAGMVGVGVLVGRSVTVAETGIFILSGNNNVD